MKCPKCDTEMYKSMGGLDICPGCGYGSPSVAKREAERQKKLEGENRPRSVIKGAWRLDIHFRNRGSRSEGQHGVLFHNGEPVEPDHVGEIINTELGSMKYYRRPEDIIFQWDLTGWNYADEDKVRPSYADRR